MSGKSVFPWRFSRIARTRAIIVCIALLVPAATRSANAGAKGDAQAILNTTGVKGGVVVHVGCGDGRLTAALHANDSTIVQGLDTDAGNVAKARAYVLSKGLYGKVTVEPWTGKHLPYIDNFVNLLVVSDKTDVPREEMLRVLAPNGVAVFTNRQSAIENRKFVKPWPKDIDEWTHYLHDATGNAVAHDTVVGPPRRMQWVGGPMWSRHHDHMASLSALVSAGGRIFYIMDEGPKDSIQLPPRWFLTARDAFNGTVLWKRPIEKWYNHLYPLKSGPAQLTRRMAAAGDRVYVTVGINAPVSEIDAATGKTLRIYEGTKTAEEILHSNGLLILLVNPDRKPVDYRQENAHCWTEQHRASARYGWDGTPRELMAVEAATGKCVWKYDGKIAPLSLAADGKRVVFCDGESVVCLDQGSGKKLWRSEPIAKSKLIPTGWSPRMILYDDVVLYVGQKRRLVALSGEDGTLLWQCKLHPSGHFCPEDVFVVNGLVWSLDIASAWPRRVRGKMRGSKGTFTGRDPRTGEVKSEFEPDTKVFACMHQRCYPSKATERYIMTSWLGIEFIDLKRKHWQIHHWVRGGCIYGVMPANGLVYAPPHPCACYYQSKLCGFNALAPESQRPEIRDQVSERLKKGPAYSAQIQNRKSKIKNPEDWPTYRHDAARSGRIKADVPAELKPSWQTKLGGRITPPVVADGRLFVASVDTHTVYALDAASGKKLWSFIAGGRVDSPPTLHKGRVLFGSADGWVYCLRASDGALAWRFRAAPADMRLMSYEQIESVWPVHGSVLVQGDVLYCLAGRSMFLDGGMRLVRLDPETGKMLSETVLDDRVPGTKDNLQTRIRAKKMPVALPDILSSDGKLVYMRSQRFDLDGKRTVIDPEPQTDQEGEGVHLFCPTGFLDDRWFHRSYWIYGKNAGEGWSEWFIPGRLVPTGRILVFDDERVYGYGRDPEYLCNSSVLEYRLFAAGKRVVPERTAKLKKAKQDTVDWRRRLDQLTPEQRTAVDYKWLKEHPPLLPRAMVLANKTLFIAGPPDVVDEKDIWGRTLEPEVQAKLAAQSRALDGEQGGILWAVSAENGKKLAEYKLDTVPVFDGMIAADGRLYLAAKDGSVSCWGR
ncbi:MAG: PQQ-binding-like beta-propeller repeat protein [Planctomycetes bacterium]|nr:PQQ-binding-like beta-propeller repeat protein [Planctomycetota bacterium]